MARPGSSIRVLIVAHETVERPELLATVAARGAEGACPFTLLVPASPHDPGGMYYPVTDAAMDTASYEEFADGPWLTRNPMEWFWDAYIADPSQRSEITASPNQATLEQVNGLPPTLLLVDEADPLRDEGEAYAAKLRLAEPALRGKRDRRRLGPAGPRP